MLILVCGLPASGKSNLARGLAKKVNAQALNTDIVRKELLLKPNYTVEEKELIYDVTFLLTKYLLKNRRNVIIDGTFYKKKLRNRVREIANLTRSRFNIIECVCSEEVIKERMERRAGRTGNLSDADFEVYEKIKAEFEPITEDHIVVHTDGDHVQTIAYLLEKLRN